MDNDVLARLAAKTAAEVCPRVELEEAARKVLRSDLSPGQYLAVLMEQHLYTDAIRFLAHALPKREAVWWACVCLRSLQSSASPPAAAAALQAAEKWVADPSDANRRVAMSAASAAGLSEPAGCIAAACFWSGGSIAPPDLPAVAPAEHLTAHTVAAALMLAAVRTEPAQAAEKFRQILQSGRDVANGLSRWQSSGAPK
jgi:hypothetical protein